MFGVFYRPKMIEQSSFEIFRQKSKVICSIHRRTMAFMQQSPKFHTVEPSKTNLRQY